MRRWYHCQCSADAGDQLVLFVQCKVCMIEYVQGLVNFEGYYLDGEDVYSLREPVYQPHKVADLEAEAKYTENRTMIRLTARYQIRSALFSFLLF